MSIDWWMDKLWYTHTYIPYSTTQQLKKIKLLISATAQINIKSIMLSNKKNKESYILCNFIYITLWKTIRQEYKLVDAGDWVGGQDWHLFGMMDCVGYIAMNLPKFIECTPKILLYVTHTLINVILQKQFSNNSKPIIYA